MKHGLEKPEKGRCAGRLEQDMTERLILVVEDEPKIARLLAEYLSGPGGFASHVLHRGDEVLPWLQARPGSS